MTVLAVIAVAAPAGSVVPTAGTVAASTTSGAPSLALRGRVVVALRVRSLAFPCALGHPHRLVHREASAVPSGCSHHGHHGVKHTHTWPLSCIWLWRAVIVIIIIFRSSPSWLHRIGPPARLLEGVHGSLPLSLPVLLCLLLTSPLLLSFLLLLLLAIFFFFPFPLSLLSLLLFAAKSLLLFSGFFLPPLHQPGTPLLLFPETLLLRLLLPLLKGSLHLLTLDLLGGFSPLLLLLLLFASLFFLALCRQHSLLRCDDAAPLLLPDIRGPRTPPGSSAAALFLVTTLLTRFRTSQRTVRLSQQQEMHTLPNCAIRFEGSDHHGLGVVHLCNPDRQESLQRRREPVATLAFSHPRRK
mmetsp:Transcript_81003/g.194313  ORF Transcript_81003/g.194313 Transcript_81003/m.194313 type:complete len:355 (-) Transcript_81003:1199-2263(-)